MSYSSNKVHHSHSFVAFSWENKPGERKAADHVDKAEEAILHELREDKEEVEVAMKLPPPPCEKNTRALASFHDMQIPLPPCAFVLKNSSSRRGTNRKEDDPFLIAYKECTKTSSGRGNYGFRNNMSLMSCKRSCSVNDDSIVRIAHIPKSKSTKETRKD